MKIHYLSCHQTLEFDEVSLLTELGHQVFSNGAYLHPEGHYLLARPGIPGAKYYPEYAELAAKFPKTQLPSELIEPFDTIIIMHDPMILAENWPRIRHKRVIWRSIGQSNPSIEQMLKTFINQGLQIVRYSPKEALLPNYAGHNSMIRFYKDPNEWLGWTGHDKKVINFTQSLKGRRLFCHYDHIMEAMAGYPAKVFGPGNNDLGNLNGGDLPYDLQKGQLRDSRVCVYGGTWPAAYTLSFMEAWMTGTPIVSIGKRLAEHLPGVDYFPFFEVPDMIQNGQTGFVSDDSSEIRSYIKSLLDDEALAKRISEAGRKKAIEIFGKTKIMDDWRRFLG